MNISTESDDNTCIVDDVDYGSPQDDGEVDPEVFWVPEDPAELAECRRLGMEDSEWRKCVYCKRRPCVYWDHEAEDFASMMLHHGGDGLEWRPRGFDMKQRCTPIEYQRYLLELDTTPRGEATLALFKREQAYKCFKMVLYGLSSASQDKRLPFCCQYYLNKYNPVPTEDAVARAELELRRKRSSDGWLNRNIDELLRMDGIITQRLEDAEGDQKPEAEDNTKKSATE